MRAHLCGQYGSTPKVVITTFGVVMVEGVITTFGVVMVEGVTTGQLHLQEKSAEVKNESDITLSIVATIYFGLLWPTISPICL